MLRTFSPRVRRSAIVAGLAAVALFAAACSSDNVAGPNAAPAQAVFGKSKTKGTTVTPSTPTSSGTTTTGVTGHALLRNTPLALPVVRSFTVTKAAGGSLVIPETGLSLYVSAGAIDSASLTITVTALEGNAVAYSFEPHGTAFRSPVLMYQDLNHTNWAANRLFKLLGGGYFKDDAQVNKQTGETELDEGMSVLLVGQSAFMGLWHFSGYMISMD